jgi:hypothetical protein
MNTSQTWLGLNPQIGRPLSRIVGVIGFNTSRSTRQQDPRMLLRRVLWICCTLYRLIGSVRPKYLFDELQFGRSTRLFNLIVPTARASSFFVQGAIRWNSLPPAVRRETSLRGFWNECLS